MLSLRKKFINYEQGALIVAQTSHTKNYYNIPNFEKQWKEAKLEGDGVPLPVEE